MAKDCSNNFIIGDIINDFYFIHEYPFSGFPDSIITDDSKFSDFCQITGIFQESLVLFYMLGLDFLRGISIRESRRIYV